MMFLRIGDMENYNFSEDRHFDFLVERCGDVWWGNKTEAGIERQHRRAKMLAELLCRYNCPTVLEVGCGAGAFSQHILKELPHTRFIGCDTSPKAIKIAKERCGNYSNSSFIMANAVSLPYGDLTFEAIVGNSILHHLPLEISLREFYRILKHGGMIWFSEPNMMNPQVFIEKNIYIIGKMLQNTKGETAFFRWALAKKLKDVGFQNIVVQPFDFLHPLIPRYLIKIVNKIGDLLEKTVILKEIAGSLIIKANKPNGSYDKL